MSSLTVARQRGIYTRFPVFAKRRRRAFLNMIKIRNVKSNVLTGTAEVKRCTRVQTFLTFVFNRLQSTPLSAAKLGVTFDSVMQNRTGSNGRAAGEVFNGWKEIAAYLRKGVRTVQRYERTLGLPIRRPAGKLSGAVLATKAELDAWLAASPFRHSLSKSKNAEFAFLYSEFSRNVEELKRLRSETKELRAQLSGSLDLLRANLRRNLIERRAQASVQNPQVGTGSPLTDKIQ
jgi:hypothetical protein